MPDEWTCLRSHQYDELKACMHTLHKLAVGDSIFAQQVQEFLARWAMADMNAVRRTLED